MTIYTSDHETPALPEQSIFHYMFPEHPNESVVPPASRDASHISFIDGHTGRQLKRGELEDNALRLATGLRALGLKRGNTALLFSPNSLEWVVAAFGLQATGVTVSPSNIAYGARELAHQYNDSGSTAVFLHPALLPVFEEARKLFKTPVDDSHVILTCLPEDKPKGTKYKSLYEVRGERGRAERFDGKDAQDVAWLCYSSGTTGLPKGVMTTHHNMTSQMQAVNIVYPDLKPGQDSILGVLPFSHIFGLMSLVHQPLTSGVPVVVFPRFEEIPVLKGIERFKITYGTVVPPIILLLVHSQNTKKHDISSLHTLQVGAAPLSSELAAAFEKRYTHCKLAQGYGLTETTPAITYAIAKDAEGRKGSCGRLVPTYEARLVGDDGNDVPRGERGEIWVRGPSVMKGYHNNEAATEKTFAPGRWFMTGDVCVRDEEGWYTIVDRVKELIKYKGFQVPPAELEALLLTHPQIIDTGVIGVWVEEQATELPRAYVVASPAAGIKTDADREQFGKAVAEWVRERVAPHKRLRGGVVVIDAIPKSPSGKILRKDLRAQAQEELKRGVDKAKL